MPDTEQHTRFLTSYLWGCPIAEISSEWHSVLPSVRQGSTEHAKGSSWAASADSAVQVTSINHSHTPTIVKGFCSATGRYWFDFFFFNLSTPETFIFVKTEVLLLFVLKDSTVVLAQPTLPQLWLGSVKVFYYPLGKQCRPPDPLLSGDKHKPGWYWNQYRPSETTCTACMLWLSWFSAWDSGQFTSHRFSGSRSMWLPWHYLIIAIY